MFTAGVAFAGDLLGDEFHVAGVGVAALFFVAEGAQVGGVCVEAGDGGGDEEEEAFVAGAGYDVW